MIKSLFLKINSRLFPRPVSTSRTELNVLDTFPAFLPESAGSYEARADLTLQCINSIFYQLSMLASDYAINRSFKIIPALQWPVSSSRSVDELGRLFTSSGSDKSTGKNYHHIYASLFPDPSVVSSVLEIGLGSNNPNVISNMGTAGVPGASCRAFRSFFTSARIYGADIDSQILFSEDRIETFYVNQQEPSTFTQLGCHVPATIDLIIDDGLHMPSANIATLNFALSRVSLNGWVVLEDLSFSTKDIWCVVASLLPSRFKCYWIEDTACALFAVHRQA